LETLFVFPTSKVVIDALPPSDINEKSFTEMALYENVHPFKLLIPVYKDDTAAANIAKFNISANTRERLRGYIADFTDEVLALQYDIPLDKLVEARGKINSSDFFRLNENIHLYDMHSLLYRVLYHIDHRAKVIDKIKPLGDEINHFRHIKVSLTEEFNKENLNSLKEKIEKVGRYKNFSEEELESRIHSGKKTIAEIRMMLNSSKSEMIKDLTITNIAKHYYLPVIYSDKENVDYISHIIRFKSEVQFIRALESYISGHPQQKNQWMFSRIDETLDRLGIPYFHQSDNKYREFFPDFIFWVKDGNNYQIFFIDPKGTSRTNYESKVDGFEKLFGTFDSPKHFVYKDFDIVFRLMFKNDEPDSIGRKYKPYWSSQDDFSFLED
jgi:hypothetical protein